MEEFKICEFSELKGKTIVKIDGLKEGSSCVLFYTDEGIVYKMHHEQECCEDVVVDDVNGDVDDLLNSPVLKAESVSNPPIPGKGSDDSYEWTFYKLATEKGYVDIRWYGTSNGWYSESVDFEKNEENMRTEALRTEANRLIKDKSKKNRRCH